MKENPANISVDLIAKYLAGEASEQEVDTVNKWAESDINAQQLYEYEAVWKDMGYLPTFDSEALFDFDVDRAWEKVNARRHASKQTSFPWMQIAAAVVVAVGLGFWLLNQRVEEVQLIADNTTLSETLSDGSIVTLNVNSSITYPKTFKKESRKVELKGEAFFEVEHQPEQTFEVTVSEASVRVLGTKFNVNDLSKDSTVVFVESGKVLFYNDNSEVILTEGMTGTLNKETGLITATTNSVVVGEATFWKTRKLDFNGTTLSDVILSIQRVYGKEVVLLNPVIGNCRITVSFEDEDLDQLMEVIAATLGLQLKESGGKITLDGTGC